MHALFSGFWVTGDHVYTHESFLHGLLMIHCTALFTPILFSRYNSAFSSVDWTDAWNCNSQSFASACNMVPHAHKEPDDIWSRHGTGSSYLMTRWEILACLPGWVTIYFINRFPVSIKGPTLFIWQIKPPLNCVRSVPILLADYNMVKRIFC